jgi:hypothetical protein
MSTQLTLPGEFTWGQEGEDFLKKLPHMQQALVREKAITLHVTPAEAYSFMLLEDIRESKDDRARNHRR